MLFRPYHFPASCPVRCIWVEVRRYAPFVIAEIAVPGAFEDAGNAAFTALFDYISGANRDAASIEI